MDTVPALRRLYFIRSAFALVWAVALFLTSSELGVLSSVLLVLYPLYDAAAVVVDARSARPAGPSTGLYLNLAISLLAAAGLAFAVTSGIPAVLRVWGAWAIVSGLLQLAVGLGRRRGLGGQWPMVVSGAVSVLAGASFLLQAGGDGASLAALSGYAALGGIFFLVSALRLGRRR